MAGLTGDGPTPEAGRLLRSLDLSDVDKERAGLLVDSIITDVMYSLILALDGEGSLGGVQESFELKAEDGTMIDVGDLTGPAYDYFHGGEHEARFGKQDFIAELHYLPEDGRTQPAYNGYRPHAHFNGIEYVTSASQKFISTGCVKPGDLVKARITLLAPEPLERKLRVGHNFTLNEGPVVVAKGRILAFTNEKLEK